MNIASIIVKVWTLTKLWCPNFVQAEEMHWINRSIGQALEENSKRNDDFRRYREALELIASRDFHEDGDIARAALNPK